MKNNDQLKEFINEIGFDRTLQCLIEALDDANDGHSFVVAEPPTMAIHRVD